MNHTLKNYAMTLCVLASLSLGAIAHAQATLANGREKVAPIVPTQAQLFPLEDVRLLPSPFRDAQETDRAYLLRLDPDRLLSGMRLAAGLTPKAPTYGGWDSDGSGTVGHYLSAISQMAQATGDPALRKRVDYLVSEMAACQAAGGTGLSASPWDRDWFAKLGQSEVQTESTTPWYTTHKTMAGLRDAYLVDGNVQALDVLTKMADWCIAVTSKLTDAQFQTMLGAPGTMGEFGGPHEVLADVYAITGERKYLDLAERFKHNIIFDPLARGDASILNGQHANTEIPKFVGYERIYELTGDKAYGDASQNFWNDVTSERTWANGGNSQWEHFFAPDEFESKLKEICGPETCNTYNMLKLTQDLYTRAPSARYMDYYERALYNHILPSEAPGGGFVYYTPMRPGHYRVFSRDYDAFWCCVGTGMENHGKYGGMIYAHTNNTLYVNLFIPSVLTWKSEGLTLRQQTTFPEEPKTRLILILAKPRRLTLRLRCPAWVAPGAFTVRVNGKPVPISAKPSSFIDVARVWKSGDTVELGLPMRLTTEPLPDSNNYAAFFYGPVLLAGPLGTEGLTPADFHGGGPFNSPGQLAQKKLPESDFPTLIGTPQQVLPKIVPVSGQPLTFQTPGVVQGKPTEVKLLPFYKVFFQRYALYWPVQTAGAYAKAQAQAAEEVREAATLEARTVDRVRVGEPDSETAHQFASDRSHTGSAGEPFTHWRDANGWFSYQVKVLPDQPMSLRCTYWGSDSGRTFDIWVDGTKIATETLTGKRPDDYLPVTYAIPDALTRGKSAVTVRFAPVGNSLAGGLFDLRMVRTYPGASADPPETGR
ncbi:MAG: glycoside hydrolase family 127 protein [Armatimonadota bacterium]|nr:glycoside hydrolase family 127 protein [Armatimonadota bacterium]